MPFLASIMTKTICNVIQFTLHVHAKVLQYLTMLLLSIACFNENMSCFLDKTHSGVFNVQILQNDIRGLMFNLSHHPLSAVFVKSLDTRWLEGVNVSFQLAPHDALMPAVSQGGMAMCCHNKSSQKKSSALQTWWQLEKLLATLRAILLLFAFINLEIQQSTITTEGQALNCCS